jgi:uncharacterized protein YecT (DUF1311 family)
MWVVALVFGLMVSSGAAAFDCAGVKLPSSIVICSDPELIRLADERQAAFNLARWGLDPQRDQQLLADQTAWVRSYPAACGAPQGQPPPTPVPATVRDCFRRAAEARVSYLRGYRSPADAIKASPLAAATGDQQTARSQALADWQALKAWSDAQTGDRRAGADYWAANRNVGDHLSCAEAADDYELGENGRTQISRGTRRHFSPGARKPSAGSIRSTLGGPVSPNIALALAMRPSAYLSLRVPPLAAQPFPRKRHRSQRLLLRSPQDPTLIQRPLRLLAWPT